MRKICIQKFVVMIKGSNNSRIQVQPLKLFASRTTIKISVIHSIIHVVNKITHTKCKVQHQKQ